MKNSIIIFLVALWLLPCMALAQYKDYRTYYPELDSLEQVLATNPPEGKELRDIYFQLTQGYLGINTQKSMELERYDLALSLLDKSMSEMRRIAHHLMPDTLAAVGLKQSIADFVASIPNATFSYYGDESRFDSKLEETVYRITHELVTNALKHSGASQILVDIVRYDNHVTLAVQDDGCGFDPDAASSNGMGMNNIRTRIDAFNGNLTIVSKPGVGTEVNVEFVIRV